MNAEFYNKIIRDHQELASLPQTLSEVLRVTKSDTSSAQDLAAVLSHDPALTAKILRIVNSPFYGLSRAVTTLPQAVVTLGMRAVSALALSTSVYDLTGKWQSTVDRVRFWRHSLETAIACRNIAEAVRYPRVDEAFVAGLLHDIGILVLEKSFADKYKSLWRQVEAGGSLTELEDGAWGTNHARVGQFLLEQWNIPVVICEAVGQHHNHFPPDATEPDFVLPQIVALGDLISKFSVANARPQFDYESDNREIITKNLRLPRERLASIEEQLLASTVDEAKFLEIDVGSNDDIMLEANKMLYYHYLTVENLLRENRQMQKEIAQAKLEKAALETLKTITATFNHYLNNAAATILGRAQLIQLGVTRGEVTDSKEKIGFAIDVIISGVNTIQSVLEELRQLSEFKTTVYHDDTYIIDIEKKMRQRLAQLDHAAKAQPVS